MFSLKLLSKLHLNVQASVKQTLRFHELFLAWKTLTSKFFYFQIIFDCFLFDFYFFSPKQSALYHTSTTSTSDNFYLILGKVHGLFDCPSGLCSFDPAHSKFQRHIQSLNFNHTY